MKTNEVIKGKYKIITALSKGSYGKVYEVEDINSKHRYALKVIDGGNYKKEKMQRQLAQELEIMNLLGSCTHSVKLYENFQIGIDYYLVEELCNGDLAKLSSGKRLPEEQVKYILNQLNVTFKLMIKQCIIHRDLKEPNILISLKEGRPVDSENPFDYIFKLADYGISKILLAGGEAEAHTDTICGSVGLIAPEVYTKHYNNKVDLWTIGLIMYRLLFNKKLDEIMDENDRVIFPEEMRISNEAVHLLKGLIVPEPMDRLSWNEYLEHPFFKSSSVK
jgi:serine/threonine protein kinase